jgi:hypothetical protein
VPDSKEDLGEQQRAEDKEEERVAREAGDVENVAPRYRASLQRSLVPLIGREGREGVVGPRWGGCRCGCCHLYVARGRVLQMWVVFA